MKNYGVLKAKAVAYERDDDDAPHSELHVQARGVDYRIAINVRSSRGPQKQRLIEFLMEPKFEHPNLDAARTLPIGWSDLNDGEKDEAALDYVRSNLFRAQDLQPITHMAPGPNNDLFEHVEDIFQRAIEDQSAVIYAFGERWGPEGDKKDQYFGFRPGNGVHLIHMNQGDAEGKNNTYKDGGLIVDFVESGVATAIFLKFQNQRWHTDEESGDPLSGAPKVETIKVKGRERPKPWNVIAKDSPYRLARIVGAIVNPDNGDKESVTILNSSEKLLKLNGWSLLDRLDRSSDLEGSLEPGEAGMFILDGNGAQFSNNGGTITILDEKGLKVDGVAYTKHQGRRRGQPIVF